MLERMRRLGEILILTFASVCVSTAAPTEQVALLNGKDLSGWEFVAQPAAEIASVCHYLADGSLALAGKPIGYLATNQSYKNYRLHAEWRWAEKIPKNANGGVLIHIASGPKDRAWPICLQVQLKPNRAGDLLPMAGATFAEKLSTPPDAKTPQLNHLQDNVEKPLGEWNSCDVVCENGAVAIMVNGVRENQITGAKPAAGKIGFQFEGTPYELRNVQLTPLE